MESLGNTIFKAVQQGATKAGGTDDKQKACEIDSTLLETLKNSCPESQPFSNLTDLQNLLKSQQPHDKNDNNTPLDEELKDRGFKKREGAKTPGEFYKLSDGHGNEQTIELRGNDIHLSTKITKGEDTSDDSEKNTEKQDISFLSNKPEGKDSIISNYYKDGEIVKDKSSQFIEPHKPTTGKKADAGNILHCADSADIDFDKYRT